MAARGGLATIVIAVVTAAVSLAILATDNLSGMAIAGGFIPLRFDGGVAPADHYFAVPAWLTPLTATLIHGGIAHLALNLVIFVYCGLIAERAIGAGGILVLYLVGAYAAGLGHWAFEPASPMPMIGASGAISAVVGAYALLFGRQRTRAIGPLSAGFVHVAWLAIAWIGIQLLIGVAGIAGGAIAIGAHIGGFLAGLALARPLLLWRYRSA
ncbi:Membrane associated serine protease, rhomboid family [Sphingomonas sp. EC-HK361]|uniref:rhomboid family intramembrane serine protease n=1 Tax=Sphingomonas sp. EC-HK361 TaxID=2038397 RepID=UPI0012596D50|nr:rhomboid family intramembrane serine protease [Sphingomonas sp. EC-HK361]VVT07495.1 Membrane associated serine protease, rhomboid family [Sphingomonas sp. EC-HK361]